MVKRTKYGNRRVFYDGHWFDSQGEADRWRDLCLLQKGKVIRDLHLKPRFELFSHGQHICDMIPDFAYYEKNEFVVEDHKSPATVTELFKIKSKLLLAQCGIKVRIVGKGMK